LEYLVTDPTVSVVIPVFNGERFLRDCINSVLGQTFSDFEIVVVNDGSTDGSPEILHSYSDTRLRMVSHTQNRGLAEARNTGIRSSHGNYIALLDSDDIAEPTRLADQVEAMEQDRELVYLGTWALRFQSHSPAVTKVWKAEITDTELRILLMFRNRFNASSIMFRRTIVPTELFANIPMAEDYGFAVAMSKLGKIGNLPKPLVRYRQHGASLTVSKQTLMTECVGNILRTQLEEFGMSPSNRELLIHQHIGRLLLPSSTSLLAECEDWLCRLSHQNDMVQRFEPDVFREIVSKEWFELCKHGSPGGFSAWRRYWHSSLSKAWTPNVQQRLRFFVKCLLKHRRKGGDLPQIPVMRES
jgi:Glycosyl transferase family 2